jgi:membrane associated rhomboid family serine protease
MFVRIETRRRRVRPVVTLTLLALLLAVFVYTAGLDPTARSALLARYGAVPANLWPTAAGAWPALAAVATAWTSLALHGDWLHLTGNLVFLLIFGLSAERLLGGWRFALLFLIGGALANLAGAMFFAESPAPIIGASGAVSSIVGAYLALFPRAHLGLVIPLGLYFEFVKVPASLLIGFWVLLQLTFSLVGPTFGAIAWPVHVAGFLAGIVFALLARAGIARRQRA